MSFKEGRLTAQSTMEAELVVAALAMKDEEVFCSNTMSGLGFGESFGSMPLYIDDTSALHIADNEPYLRSSRKAYRAEVLFSRARTGRG